MHLIPSLFFLINFRYDRTTQLENKLICKVVSDLLLPGLGIFSIKRNANLRAKLLNFVKIGKFSGIYSQKSLLHKVYDTPGK